MNGNDLIEHYEQYNEQIDPDFLLSLTRGELLEFFIINDEAFEALKKAYADKFNSVVLDSLNELKTA